MKTITQKFRQIFQDNCFNLVVPTLFFFFALAALLYGIVSQDFSFFLVAVGLGMVGVLFISIGES